MARSHTIAPAASLVLVGLMGLTACAATAAASSPASSSPAGPVVEASPEPTYVEELPEWAREGGPLWLVYPDGFECWGTEGCPNDYVAFFGQPGPVLPDGVEYYDPEIHHWLSGTDKAMVRPADD